jgi:hypothetical protein
MLMDIKCSMVPSIKVHLRFDDHSEKCALVSIGDLIWVQYNANGCRKTIEGKVIKVCAYGEDPKSWYIVVDGSDDFESQQAKFSPMSILDIEILRKAGTLDSVQTVSGDYAVPYLRIVKGRLQYSIDSFDWKPIRIDNRDIIEDQEGTVPIDPPPCPHPHDDFRDDCGSHTCGIGDNDGIEDANW